MKITIREYNKFKRSYRAGHYENQRYGDAFYRNFISDCPLDTDLCMCISLDKAEELIIAKYLLMPNR